MKKVFMIGAILALCFQIINAQSEVGRRSDRKIIELKKIVELTPSQEEAIRVAYEEYSDRNDSILYKVQDPIDAAYLKRNSEKTYHQKFMNSLSQTQQNTYIEITSTPEVMEKAEAKVAVLREDGEYNDAQLDSAKTQIFNYLMLEKVVYKRDKYNYVKQKENIAQLKKLSPKTLRESNAKAKLKHNGVAHTGRYQW